MDAGSLCSRPARSIDARKTVREAAMRMIENHVGTLVAIGRHGEAVGLITDRDIVVRCVALEFDPDTMPVLEIMSEPVEAIPETTSVEMALGIMAEREVRRLVIRDPGGEAVGVLSLDDILGKVTKGTDPLARLIRSQMVG